MKLNWMLDEYDGIVYVSDLETYELRYINQAGSWLYGIDKEQATKEKKKCYEILQNRTSPCPFCTNHYLEENGFYEWEHYNPFLKRTLLLKDRKFIWEGRESRIEFATDITKYRDKIKQKENERDSVLKSLPGGIARVDARDSRTILWYGANFLPMIGYTKEQFEHELHSKCNYVHPEDLDKVTQIMTDIKETGRIVITEMRIITRAGNERILTTTFSYEDGKTSEDGIPSFYSVGIDITEMKEEQNRQHLALEEAYQAAKAANKAKTDFLSNMSHDIRTPMNAMMGMVTIAQANIGDSRKVEDCLDKINTAGRHLLALVNEVLDMSRIESGHINLSEESFELGGLLQRVLDVCRPLLAERDHDLQVDIGTLYHEKVYGDRERLGQVFINILSNAVKYTPKGGRIKISIQEKQLHVSQASLYIIRIQDNGIGMTQSYMERIFEPFSRAEDSRVNKIQGTGLGMAISENIIHMMNGTIEVESKLGVGSCFTVNVPLKVEKEEAAAKELEGRRVLVVGDAPSVCENACLLLKKLGMSGKWVTDGNTAVEEILCANKTGTEYFSVLLDWRMPGQNGLEAARAMRNRIGPDFPMIIISGFEYSNIEAEFVRSGADYFIEKPLFQSKLLEVFQKILNKARMPEAVLQDTQAKTDFTGRRFLVVEDNQMNREIAKELLQMTGAFVETAENGKMAVNCFAQSEIGYYDIILMDIQMPFLNGYDATNAIRSMEREDAKTVTILALTANAFSEDIAASKKAGLNEHLAKPIDAKVMYRTISKWIHIRKENEGKEP